MARAVCEGAEDRERERVSGSYGESPVIIVDL